MNERLQEQLASRKIIKHSQEGLSSLIVDKNLAPTDEESNRAAQYALFIAGLNTLIELQNSHIFQTFRLSPKEQNTSEN